MAKKDCAKVKRTITKAQAKKGGHDVAKTFTFMSKPSGCGTPQYKKPTAAQSNVRETLAAVGRACRDTGSIGGKNGMSAKRKACVKEQSSLLFHAGWVAEHKIRARARRSR